MQKLHKWFSRRTQQTAPLLGAGQVKMRSGGYGWEVDDWTRLQRFLVLGCEGGTYYVSERKLTRESAQAVLRCLKADGLRVVSCIQEVSSEGRAPKNDPALFALAICAKLGDEQTRAAAYRALPAVARTGTHLFHFCEYVKAFGGLGGNGFKRALARWYTTKQVDRLAFQAIKYQQRDGWSHRDVLRLAHPIAQSQEQQDVFSWMVKGWQGELGSDLGLPAHLGRLWALEKAKTCTSAQQVIRLITDYRLPHECVPNYLKQHAEVWEALLADMPVGAMLRNLNKMTAVGLLSGSSMATEQICRALRDVETLSRARIHPMAILLALKTYAAGRGFKGSLRWSPVGQIVDALDKAFYLSFKVVRPTGRRLCLALDVSGSMTSPVSSSRMLTCREAAAALALVTANVEHGYEMVAFTSGGPGRVAFGKHAGLTPVSISPRQRLDDVVKELARLPFGGTDCALPMRWALQTKTKVDAFVIYTDSESWAGEIHVDQALNDYRQRLGVPAKLVAVALSGDRFSVANPKDAGQMDVVGFDTATPDVISDFVSA